MRGINVEVDEKPKTVRKMQNLHVTFGCAPKKGVAAKSTMVSHYTTCLTKYFEKKGGVLELPRALDDFRFKYENSASFRNDVTQKLYFDVNGTLSK